MVSNESGRNEIYVRGFPQSHGKWRVSTNGGIAPRWPRNAKELFYVENNQLMAIPVTTEPAFSSGTPRPLFTRRTLRSFNPQYDVTADGKRIVLTDRLVDEKPLAIHVVHNWSWDPATVTAPVELRDVLGDKVQPAEQSLVLEAWDVRVFVETPLTVTVCRPSASSR